MMKIIRWTLNDDHNDGEINLRRQYHRLGIGPPNAPNVAIKVKVKENEFQYEIIC